MSPTLSLEELQARVDQSPVNRWLDLTVDAVTEDSIVIRMLVRPDMIGNPNTGVLHGGLMACLIDAAGSFAVIACTGQSATTVDFRVDFHAAQRKPALFATTELLKLGRRLASVEIRVRDSEGCLIASGRAVYMNAGHTAVNKAEE
jgi:uncharacterized protein (TIGR00369 family)